MSCVLSAYALTLASVLAGPAAAQDPRGSISGRIVDSSGARLPGVTVTVTNMATAVKTPTVTNADGIYAVLFLTPGTYTVIVEMSGFKKSVRDGLEVRIGDRLTVDLTLEIGRLEETVSVTAESPLLDMASGSAGQVIDAKRISLMPLSDGNPFALARLVPGVAYTGDLKFSRPFDNGGTSSINADGSTGGNEFSLDGSPNMANGRRVAFVPPAGAVQEFKVSTASFDAADGHTAGALVNVTLKSGTNSLKGEAYYYMRRDRFEATDFFIKKAGQPKPKVTYDRPGGFARRSRPRAGAVRRPEPDVLLRGRGMALRRVSRARASHGAERGDAQRRLLGVARAVRAGDHLRSADRREIGRARRPDAVRRQHHSDRSPQPDWAADSQVLPDAEPGRRSGDEQLLFLQSARRTRSTRFRRASITGSATSSTRSCGTPATAGANRATRTSAPSTASCRPATSSTGRTTA